MPPILYLREKENSLRKAVEFWLVIRPKYSCRACEKIVQAAAPVTLRWSEVLTQWHEGEINAWAMEQAVVRLVEEGAAHRLKGELGVCAAVRHRSHLVESNDICGTPDQTWRGCNHVSLTYPMSALNLLALTDILRQNEQVYPIISVTCWASYGMFFGSKGDLEC